MLLKEILKGKKKKKVEYERKKNDKSHICNQIRSKIIRQIRPYVNKLGIKRVAYESTEKREHF